MTVTDTMPPPSPFPDLGIDGLVGFHIRLASAVVYQQFTQICGDLGLTQKQVAILWLIEEQPGIAQADIGRRLKMDRASVMAVINRLQDRKLLKRGVSEQDRRRQTLTLTQAGCEALVQARARIAAHEDWLKARFSPAESAMLVELLQRIHGDRS
ncbi:MAG TPA: MarR family transcriptional regulator [Sphingobium sp.]